MIRTESSINSDVLSMNDKKNIKQEDRVIIFNGDTSVYTKIADFYLSGIEPKGDYRGITRALSTTKDQTGLQAWRERVGEEEAEKILAESQVIGTSLDKILLNCFLPNFDQDEWKDEVGYFLFKRLKPYLKKINPIALQLKLWSDHLKLIGYLDCIGYYDGKITLIDFKNSRSMKSEEHLEDYFLQCTLYCMMIYELTGIKVENIMLLIAVRNSSFPQIVKRETKNYVKEAISRVTAYHKLYPNDKRNNNG